MRLTQVLNHAKYFWWGKGWGPKPRTDTNPRYFKIQWMAKSKRKLFECFQTLPPNAKIEDPNEYVKRCFERELTDNKPCKEELVFPWPHSQRPIKGSPEDPNYQSKSALLYKRNRQLLDPINQSLVFTNTVVENERQIPESVVNLKNDIVIDEELIDLIERRLEWCQSSDSTLRKLPIDRQFPYLDQRPPRVYGIPRSRKEANYLRTLYDLSQMYISRHYGFVNTFKISHPYCVVPLERNNRLVVLDLETDFITTAKSNYSLPLFSTTPLMTIDKPLASIEPLSWTTCFYADENFYPTDWSFTIPTANDIHTIYLSHASVANVDNDSFIGRAIFYSYGYAVSQARVLYGDHINNKELPDPIPIQCVFINPKDFSLGFVCFQLNTTSFESSLKNQVWIKEPILDINEVMKYLIAFELNGCVDNISRKLKISLSNV